MKENAKKNNRCDPGEQKTINNVIAINTKQHSTKKKM